MLFCKKKKVKKWDRLLFIFLVALAGMPACLCAQYDEELNSLLAKAREASFYDSAHCFAAGEAAISKAQASFPAAEAEVLIWRGNFFLLQRMPDKARLNYEKALSLAEKYGDRRLVLLSRIRLAFLHYDQHGDKTSVNNLERLLDSCKRIGDHKNTAELLGIIGSIKESNDDLEGAGQLYRAGVTLSEQHRLPYYGAMFRNSLGRNRFYRGEESEALEHFEAGLRLALANNEQRLAVQARLNLCRIYIAQNKLEDMRRLFSQVRSYARSHDLTRELAIAYIDIGRAFMFAEKAALAIPYFDSAVDVLKDKNFSRQLLRAYDEKADAFFLLGKKDEARRVMETVQELSKNFRSASELMDFHFFNYRYHINNGDDAEALKSYRSYVEYRDSMRNNLNSRIMRDVEMKFEMQKKETELQKSRQQLLMLENENRDEKLKRWVLAGSVFGGSLALAGLLYFSYSRKLRDRRELYSRELIEKIEEERKRIAMDLHDEIGQELSLIRAEISRKGGKDLESIGSHLGKVIEKTRMISRDLFPSFIEKIGLKRAVASMLESIQASSGIECSFEICDEAEALPATVRTQLFRIIQECTGNTLKHSEGAGALKVMIEKKSDEFLFVYMDNGKGLSEAEMGKTTSLLSIRERVKMIGGTFTFGKISGQGARIVIKFATEQK